jgi:hypothetical protein
MVDSQKDASSNAAVKVEAEEGMKTTRSAGDDIECEDRIDRSTQLVKAGAQVVGG